MLLLSVLLHVQYGCGLPTFRKGQKSLACSLASFLDTVAGLKSSGTNEVTVRTNKHNYYLYDVIVYGLL